MTLGDKEGFEYAKKILGESAEFKLDENPLFPRDVDKEKLREWFVRVRKMYTRNKAVEQYIVL